MQALIDYKIDTIKTTINAQRYFGINFASIMYTPNVALMKGGIMEMKHYFSTFSEINDFVVSFFEDHISPFTDIYISTSIVKASSVKDTLNKKVFDKNPDFSGWLVFVDPVNIANWSHECEYWLFKNTEQYIFSDCESWKPISSIDIIKIKLHKQGEE